MIKMMSLDDLVKAVKGRKLKIYNDMKLKADRDLTEKLTICIPDMHILERGPNDDFINGNTKHEKRFLSLLEFILELVEKEGNNVEIIQLGDMFDLWQAKWNTNMIVSAQIDTDCYSARSA